MTEDRAHYETDGAVQEPKLPIHTLLPNTDPTYTPPSAKEIRAVINYLGWTGGEAGRELGVGGRAVRNWLREDWPEDQKPIVIPYAAWQLLLIHAGITRWEWVNEPMANGRPGRAHRLVPRYPELQVAD